MDSNTLFLRLEGPLQAWGDHQSKFVVRRTAEAPTKSGVIGLLCAALGISRRDATENYLQRFTTLRMAVRIDRPGVRWWDYHTVGAHMKMRTAEDKSKPGAMPTRREYLCDASFLVALQGEPRFIEELKAALQKPRWALYLGRKCCPPSRPILEQPPDDRFNDLLSAVTSIPWRPRTKHDIPVDMVDCLLEWTPSPDGPNIPVDAEVWYDVPLSFEPPSHGPRVVVRRQLHVGPAGEIGVADKPLQNPVPRPSSPRANYSDSQYRKIREQRLQCDHHLCVFCKAPATTVQHVTYRRAGGNERLNDLRSLCRLCHDAVTMLEYGFNMGLDRINPEDPRWREQIIKKREEIIKFRSLETRRRRLAPEEVE